MSSMELWLAVGRSVIKASTPLLLGTLGGIYIERSGVLNLGAEGLMIVGAVTGFVVAVNTGNPALGVLAAALASMMLALVYGVFVVTLRANQVVSGLALTMFGLGISSLMGKEYVGIPAPHLPPVPIPILSRAPIVGRLLFSHDPLVYTSLILTILLWFILYKTRVGMAVRAVGEAPAAADAMGVNVYRVRYACLALGGALIGVAGAYLSLSYIPAWTEGLTAGRGWVVVALTVFSMWDPLRALLGAYLYGGVEVLQYHLQP
ncbi:MAG: ABC transporter permease, partial [Thermoprotei archaeon]